MRIASKQQLADSKSQKIIKISISRKRGEDIKISSEKTYHKFSLAVVVIHTALHEQISREQLKLQAELSDRQE
jgi:hypothetical protein